MDVLIKDVRYALRGLLKTRGFTVVAVITLALGIGANTAMFSVVNAVLLRPLPFRDSGRLVAVGEYNIRHGAVAVGSFSYPNYLDVRARNHSFEDLAVYTDGDGTLTGLGDALHVSISTVSAGLFNMLGAQPQFGRTFLPEEDQPGHHVVLLSDAFWRKHFNSDRGVIGKTIALNGREFTIVGVMPPGFQFPVRSQGLDLWNTFSRTAEKDAPDSTPLTEQRGAHWMNGIARLKPGVSAQQANQDLNAVGRALASEYPDYNTDDSFFSKSLIDEMVGDTRTTLILLLGAVGLVLLIACANVANLLLARSSGRSREIAIRAALGARSARIVRQLVTESVVLAVLGGTLGIAVAEWALSAFLRLYPQNLPRAAQVGIDVRVMLFTIAIALVTGVLFGLAPAVQLASPNLTDTMRDGARGSTTSARQNRLRSVLVVSETAIGVMLLIGAGLLLRSLQRLSRADLGLNPSHVLTAKFDLSETKYNADAQDRFYNELQTRIRALPGVINAAGALPLPISDDNWTISFNLVDHPLPKSKQPAAVFYNVLPGFFETMQIALVRGRFFDERDQRNSPPVMIITQAFAKKYFVNEDPIGKMVEIGAGEGPKRKQYKIRQVVGIVGDIRTSDIGATPAPAFYVPTPQLVFGPPVIVVRTAGDPTAVTSAVRNVLSSMDPNAPMFDVRTLEDWLALDLGRARFQTILLTVFAGIALLLTAVGLYGVMAYAVVQRTHEIGVRMALGATRSDVLRMVLHRGVTLTLAGMAAGVLGALGLARFIQSLLYQIPPRDPVTYIAVCAALGAVAMLASYIPALRATRVDPMVALRYE